MEKIVIACLGKYLEESGVYSVFLENEIFWSKVVNNALSGGHYIRGKRAVGLIAEALLQIQLSRFLEKTDISQFEGFFHQISNLQKLFETNNPDPQMIRQQWDRCQSLMANFVQAFNAYKEQSEQFRYWNAFLEDLYPILRDLTRSHREGNWQLHISAVRRALPLIFAFDRTNYSRLAPLYYEDCIALEETFPTMYERFENGGFVVQHSLRCGSGVPMDHALEKEYNKPAKGHRGIIGVSRIKEAVCKWNIIKHEKSQYIKYLHELCCLNEDDEYSLHHEFVQTKTDADTECVEQIANYITQRSNPFKISSSNDVTNIVTGKQVAKEKPFFLLSCVIKGEERYIEYRSARLKKKCVKLFDPIPRTQRTSKSLGQNKKEDIKKETISSLRCVNYARLCTYSISELLRYELTSTSFFLTKDRFLRKSPKPDLTRQIEKNLQVAPPHDVPQSDEPSMIVSDFMAYARKVPVKKLKLNNFGDFVQKLWNTISYISRHCDRIDIIFDLNLQQSIKQYERNRRSKRDAIIPRINQMDQPLPIDMERFWSSSENKVGLQQFCIKWMIETDTNNKPVYLEGSHLQDLSACIKLSCGNKENVHLLRCDHEEADDRIMFHINYGVTVDMYHRSIVASADTDVFVCLIHFFSHWTCFAVKELWVVCGQGSSTRVIPVHDVVSTIDPSVINVLTALHALSGCETTSQGRDKEVSTKGHEGTCL